MEKYLEIVLFESGDYKFTAFDLFLILITVLVSWLTVRILSRIILRNARKKKEGPEGQSYALIQIVRYLVYSLAVVLCLELAGVNVTVLIAGSTALLVGVGLGLQNTFNDFVSGIILLFEGSVRVFDVIEVDGIIGRVKKIGLRTSEIKTRDAIILIVPNSKLVSNHLINWSLHNNIIRHAVTVGVHYKSDVNKVTRILLKQASDLPTVLEKPEPYVRFEDFGESSLNFNIFFFSQEKMLIEDVQSELRYRIWQAFKREGVEIPYPQRDLHFRSDFREADQE